MEQSIWSFSTPPPDPTQGSLNRQQAAARQLRRNRSSRGRNQRVGFRSAPYTRPSVERIPQPPPQPAQTTPSQTPCTMQHSTFATTAHDGDAMDIDTPSPVHHSRIPVSPRNNPTSTTEQPHHEHVHRHLFYIPMQTHNIPTLDYDIIRLARVSVTTLRRQGLPIPDTLPVGNGVPHVYILIDSELDNRGHALQIASRRLGVMQDMIRDGLGWFTGLPYRHPNFEVKFIRNRSPNSLFP